MYLHIVMMAFNKEVTAPLREQIEKVFQNIPRECDGVVRFELVENRSHTSAAYTHALLSVFSSELALEGYRTGAAHSKLMAELGPHIKEIVVLDSVLRQDL